MHRKFSLFGTTSTVLASLFFLFCELGDQPLGPTEDEIADQTADSLSIPVDRIPEGQAGGLKIDILPSVVSASIDSNARVAVVVMDAAERTPLANRVVRFRADDGYIHPRTDTTNDSGFAYATFRQLGDSMPRNGEVWIYAWTTIGRDTVAVKRSVTLKGLKIHVTPEKSIAVKGERVAVAVKMVDGGGMPVGNARVNVTLDGTVRADSTRGDGTIAFSVTSATAKLIPIHVQGRGAVGQTVVSFLDSIPTGTAVGPDEIVQSIQLFVDPTVVRATHGDTAKVSVRAYDYETHNPIAGATVEFGSRWGFIMPTRDTTGSDGRAYATYIGIPLNVIDTVWVNVLAGDTTLADTVSVLLDGVALTLSPQFRHVDKGDTVPVTITLFDGAGDPVANAKVNLSGALAATVTTSAEGRASTRVTRATQGTVKLVGSAKGATDSVIINFYNETPPELVDRIDVRELRLFSSKAQLRADNSDNATITAIYVTEQGNPAAGEEIFFKSTHGIIDRIGVVGTDGRANVTLQSSAVNITDTITAISADGKSRDTTYVMFNGVTLQLVPEVTELKVGDFANVDALLRDGSGKPLGGDSIQFKILGNAGLFGDGKPDPHSEKSDAAGLATSRVTSASSGQVVVVASALGAHDSVTLTFSNSRLTLRASRAGIPAGGNLTSTITATYVDSANNPIQGVEIKFATNAGTILTPTAVTNQQGGATTILRPAAFAGIATIVASAPGGDAHVQVAFTASTAGRIELALSPDNIGTNGGVATLTATVTDSNGNMVTAADVNFKILQGPGGGEYITKPLVTTQDGTARSSLMAGSQPSQYRGVQIVASVGDIADTTKMTISGEPHTITVSRPQDDTVTVPAAGNLDRSVFHFFVGAVIKDVNGNPVADGTEVHFSSIVSGMPVVKRLFDHWEGIESAYEDIVAVYANKMIDIPFEDVNHNFAYDPEVDLDLDNFDGRSARGDDRDGNGFDYNPFRDDFFWDFNDDGLCDRNRGEPVYQMTYTRGIVGVDTLVDTAIGLKDVQVIVSDTILVYTVDTSTIWDTSRVYTVVQRETWDTTRVYNIVDRTDTLITARVDTVFVDTFITAHGEVCDTTKETDADGHVYLIHCYNDSTFAKYRLDHVSDTSYLIVYDTVGTSLEIDPVVVLDTVGTGLVIEPRIAYDTVGTEQKVELTYRTQRVIDTTVTVSYRVREAVTDSTAVIYADLNMNGVWDNSEWVDVNGNDTVDLPVKAVKGNPGAYIGAYDYDFRYNEWDSRWWFDEKLEFDDNDFAVHIDRTVVTKDGVGEALLIYPRQLAHRLFVTVNAEAGGIHDRNGERFVLPVIVGQ